MAIDQKITPITVEDLTQAAAEKKEGGWRYIQTLAVNTEAGIDLIYSFMKDGSIDNLKIEGVQKGVEVPSITDRFPAAFVFENEIHDLFGVTIVNISIDFQGNFYALAQQEPMTIISPEQKAAREKAAKVRAAKAAKEKAASAAPAAAPAAKDAELEAKLAGMDPAKAAKVRAAMEAKAAKAAQEADKQKDAELEAKLAGMDPAKAAKVRAAMEAKAAKAAQLAQLPQIDAKEGETHE